MVLTLCASIEKVVMNKYYNVTELVVLKKLWIYEKTRNINQI